MMKIMRYIVTFSFILISYLANSYCSYEENSFKKIDSLNRTSKSLKKSTSSLTTGSFPVDNQLNVREILTNLAPLPISSS